MRYMRTFLFCSVVVIVVFAVNSREISDTNVVSADGIVTTAFSPPKPVPSKTTGNITVSECKSNECDSVELHCCFKDAFPPPHIKWATGRTDEGRRLLPKGSAKTSHYNDHQDICSKLEIGNVTRRHAGTYRCIANNGVGEPVVVRMTVDVKFAPFVHPVEQPKMNVTPGRGPIVLTFEFQAPRHDYVITLLRNNVLVHDSPQIERSLTRKGTNGTYTVNLLTNLSEEEVCGLWEFRVQNDLGGNNYNPSRHSERLRYYNEIRSGPNNSSSQTPGQEDRKDRKSLTFSRSRSTDERYLSFEEFTPAQLDCCFKARSRPNIKWGRKESTPVGGNQTFDHRQPDYYCSRLHWANITRRDVGTYFCEAAFDAHKPFAKLYDVDVSFRPKISLRNAGEKATASGPFRPREFVATFSMEMAMHGVEITCRLDSGSSSFDRCPVLHGTGYRVRAELRFKSDETPEWKDGFHGTGYCSLYHPKLGGNTANFVLGDKPADVSGGDRPVNGSGAGSGVKPPEGTLGTNVYQISATLLGFIVTMFVLVSLVAMVACICQMFSDQSKTRFREWRLCQRFFRD